MASSTDAPGRRFGFVRRHKIVTALMLVLVLLLGTLGGWLLYLNHQLGDVPRFEADLDRPDRPDRVPSEATNILLAGVDDGGKADLAKMVSSGEWQAGSFRSDAIMVLHLTADRENAQLISFPRDSYVPIPGHGTNKINAAFSLGGPTLLAQTIEDYADLYLDHIVVVDFDGFEEITRIVGGVEVHVPETVHDSKNDKTWTAGTHQVEGEEALLYVRQRYGLPNGAFDREQRQMVFLRSLLEKLVGDDVTRNPVRLTQLVGELGELVATDDGLTSGRMRDLAISSRRLGSQDLGLATVPHLGTATVDGLSIVRLDHAEVVKLFKAVARDDFATYREAHPGIATPPRVS